MSLSKVPEADQGNAKTPRTINARAFDPLPEGLDPRTITNELLSQHGFPPRPDPGGEPELLRAWNRVMAQPTEFVRAELADGPAMAARRLSADASASVGWAGVARQQTPLTDYAYPANFVFAEIQLPVVLSWENASWPFGPGGPDDEIIAFWVGLAGLWGGANQVLRAGIAVTDSTWAWVESYDDLSGISVQKVSNFSVKPGDTVSIWVFAEGAGAGLAFMGNSRTGMATNVGIELPSDITLPGVTTIWAVEPGQNCPLPQGYVTFTNCWGGSWGADVSGEYFTLQPGGNIMSFSAPVAGTTSTTILSPNSFEVLMPSAIQP
jgi:hypothetical protein